MKKFVLPVFAVLSLLGGAAAQTPRPAAQGAGAGGNARVQRPAEIAAQQKQRCQDDYAHTVGDLAYLEARLILTSTQQSFFDRWKSIKLDNARRDAADCATRELTRAQGRVQTPLDVLAREHDNLKRRLADLEAELPVLTSFYNALTPVQKDALAHPGQEAMLMRRRDFAPGMNPGPQRGDNGPNNGPGGGPGGPPPQ